jgi:hypothetical protein
VCIDVLYVRRFFSTVGLSMLKGVYLWTLDRRLISGPENFQICYGPHVFFNSKLIKIHVNKSNAEGYKM